MSTKVKHISSDSESEFETESESDEYYVPKVKGYASKKKRSLPATIGPPSDLRRAGPIQKMMQSFTSAEPSGESSGEEEEVDCKDQALPMRKQVVWFADLLKEAEAYSAELHENDPEGLSIPLDMLAQGTRRTGYEGVVPPHPGNRTKFFAAEWREGPLGNRVTRKKSGFLTAEAAARFRATKVSVIAKLLGRSSDTYPTTAECLAAAQREGLSPLEPSDDLHSGYAGVSCHLRSRLAYFYSVPGLNYYRSPRFFTAAQAALARARKMNEGKMVEE